MTLREGDKGDKVAALQRALNREGAKLTVDGDYGPKTTGAVRKFQLSADLTIDGIAGPQTLGELDEGGDAIPVNGWLRAFDDPGLRGVRVLTSSEIEVEPWPDAVPYSSAPNGGRDGGVLRTTGEPKSMRAMMDEHREFIFAAAEFFDIPPAWVAGMCAIEAVRGHGMRWDTRSCREEPGFISDAKTPHRVSPGPMQTLISTAEGERKRSFPITMNKITKRAQLFDQHTSFMLGASYMAKQIGRYGRQPVMMCGGYNAGSARRSDESEFGVKTYSPLRVTKMIAYVNDFVAVMRERGCA